MTDHIGRFQFGDDQNVVGWYYPIGDMYRLDPSECTTLGFVRYEKYADGKYGVKPNTVVKIPRRRDQMLANPLVTTFSFRMFLVKHNGQTKLAIMQIDPLRELIRSMVNLYEVEYRDVNANVPVDPHRMTVLANIFKAVDIPIFPDEMSALCRVDSDYIEFIMEAVEDSQLATGMSMQLPIDKILILAGYSSQSEIKDAVNTGGIMCNIKSQFDLL